MGAQRFGMLLQHLWFEREHHPDELYAYGASEAELHFLSVHEEGAETPQLFHTYTPRGELMLIARGRTAQALRRAGAMIEHGIEF